MVLLKPSFQKLRRRAARLRVVLCLLPCHHPVAVDAAAAAAAVFADELLPMLMSTAVAAGSTGTATAGIARPLLIQWTHSIVSAGDGIFVTGLVI